MTNPPDTHTVCRCGHDETFHQSRGMQCDYGSGSDPDRKGRVQCLCMGFGENWVWPLGAAPLFPDAPGQFGTHRVADSHTGVDLYCELGTMVVAVAEGTVVAIEWFTGSHVQAPNGEPATWWNDTKAILVEGASGVVVYGEVDPESIVVSVGSRVRAGEKLGMINTSVLRSFKGRPMVMLHLELMAPGSRTTVWCPHGAERPANLLDPTPFLRASAPAAKTFHLAAYDGRAFIDPKAPRKDSKWWAVWGGSAFPEEDEARHYRMDWGNL